tara:strand:+ start:286 stop:579 length:294 start_codon:yes stop_codon:yes gene_type:complete
MPEGIGYGKNAKKPSKKQPKKKTSTIEIKGEKIKMEKGKLSKELGIPEEKNIPMTLLKRLVKVPNGEMFDHRGKSKKMTPGLKRRISLAITLKGFKK